MGTSDPTLERVEHARSHHEPPAQIVRYDSSGKWFVEWPERTNIPVTVGEAAEVAIEWVGNGGTIYAKQYGGERFVAEMRKRGYQV